MNRRVKEILESNRRLALPIMTHRGIEATGKSVREAVTDGSVHFEALRAVAALYPSWGITTIMDLSVEAEAFGAAITLPEDQIPHVVSPLRLDGEGVRALPVPSLEAGRLPEYLKASRLAAARLDVPVYSSCIGPFTLAGCIYGLSDFRKTMVSDPETVGWLVEKCTLFLKDYCRAFKNTGTAGILMAEPLAGLLTDEECMQYSSVYVKTIVEAVQDGEFMVIFHNCGNHGTVTKAMVATGAAALHFGNSIDMLQALKDCPPDRVVMGNLDPVGLLKKSSARQVYEDTFALLEKTSAYSNFVLSSGCDMPSRVPDENIRAFFQALSDYNA